MKNEKICAFVSDGMTALPCGANEEEESCIALKARLSEKLRQLITEGVRRFRVVMDEGPGLYAAEAVLALRGEAAAGEGVMLTCIIPCETLADRWYEALRDRFFSVMERCDEEIMLSVSDTPACRTGSMVKAAEGADIVLAVTSGDPDSNAACLLRLAEREGTEAVKL